MFGSAYSAGFFTTKVPEDEARMLPMSVHPLLGRNLGYPRAEECGKYCYAPEMQGFGSFLLNNAKKRVQRKLPKYQYN